MEPMKPMKPMQPMEPMKPMEPLDFGPGWWPEHLGRPSSSGAQNAIRYAFFPENQRLAIERNGKLSIYATGDHYISGVAQQQGGTASLVFTSQEGEVRLDELEKVE